MTKTFDSIFKDFFGENVMAPTPQQPNQPQQSGANQQQKPQNTAPQNNMNYKKVLDSATALAPEELQQLAVDLANHLKTLSTNPQQPNTQQPSTQQPNNQAQPNAANKPA